MGLATRIGSGIDKGAKGLGKQSVKQSVRHPRIASGIGGFAGGAYWMRKRNPQFYDSTPNNGRAMNKHPWGGYNG